MKQTADDAEFLNGQNPEDGQSDKTSYSADEYRNLQAFSTKNSQEKIEFAKKLVQKDPKELLTITDTKLQAKIIKDLYSYDNLDELKIMLPELFEDKNSDGNDGGDDDRVSKLEKEHQLMKFKLEKEALASELEKAKLANPLLGKAIPNFDELVKEEMKYISSELPLSERVKKAIKMISTSPSLEVETMLALQGREVKKQVGWPSTEDLTNAQNSLRKALGLKTK